MNDKTVSGVEKIEFEAQNRFIVMAFCESHCAEDRGGDVFENQKKGGAGDGQVDAVAAQTFAHKA